MMTPSLFAWGPVLKADHSPFFLLQDNVPAKATCCCFCDTVLFNSEINRINAFVDVFQRVLELVRWPVKNNYSVVANKKKQLTGEWKMVESGDAFLSVQRIFERPHTRMVKYDDEVCLSFRYRFSSFLNKKKSAYTSRATNNIQYAYLHF
jgi:hypothetical protein